MLEPMVKQLIDDGFAKESDGAICIFNDVPKSKKEKNQPPIIIKKKDGAFNYSSTDLAALRYRVNELKADRIIYVTDSGQKFHFEQLFKAAEKCGFVDRNVT